MYGSEFKPFAAGNWTNVTSTGVSVISIPTGNVKGKVDAKIEGQSIVVVLGDNFEKDSNTDGVPDDWTARGIVTSSISKNKQLVYSKAFHQEHEINLVEGHKYYISLDAYYSSRPSDLTKNYNFGIRLYQDTYGNNEIYVVGQTPKVIPANIFTKMSNIYTADGQHNLLSIRTGGIAPSNNFYFHIRHPLVIDLTASYGEGNEPTKEWCNKNLHFMTTGTKSTFPVTVKSISKNLFDSESYKINQLVNNNDESITVPNNLLVAWYTSRPTTIPVEKNTNYTVSVDKLFNYSRIAIVKGDAISGFDFGESFISSLGGNITQYW